MNQQSSPNTITKSGKKTNIKLKDEKDIQIDKLKVINQKLRNKIKELNIIVEKAIEKANSKKLLAQKEQKKENIDVDYLIRVRDKEIANSEKQIKNNQTEIDKLQQKYQELAEAENVQKLEEQLKSAGEKKKQLQKHIKELEQQNIEQGKTLDRVTNSQEYQNKIKYLMEDLRMWKDKNHKLETNFERDKETRNNQLAKMKTLEQKNQQFQSQLQKLKEQKKQQMQAQRQSMEPPQSSGTSLPAIEIKTEEDKARLRDELEEEYFKQRTELKKVENVTKNMQDQADQLKLKLKEKETMLRIAKFKLTEVNRNIKLGKQTINENKFSLDEDSDPDNASKNKKTNK